MTKYISSQPFNRDLPFLFICFRAFYNVGQFARCLKLLEQTSDLEKTYAKDAEFVKMKSHRGVYMEFEHEVESVLLLIHFLQ